MSKGDRGMVDYIGALTMRRNDEGREMVGNRRMIGASEHGVYGSLQVPVSL